MTNWNKGEEAPHKTMNESITDDENESYSFELECDNLLNDDDFNEILSMDVSQVERSLEDKGYDTEIFLKKISARQEGKLIEFKPKALQKDPKNFNAEFSVLQASVERSFFISQHEIPDEKPLTPVALLTHQPKKNLTGSQGPAEVISFKASFKNTFSIGMGHIKKKYLHTAEQPKIRAAAGIFAVVGSMIFGATALQTASHQNQELQAYAEENLSKSVYPLEEFSKKAENNTPDISENKEHNLDSITVMAQLLTSDHHPDKAYSSEELSSSSLTNLSKIDNLIKTSFERHSNFDKAKEKAIDLINKIDNGEIKFSPTDENVAAIKFIYEIVTMGTSSVSYNECYIENGIYKHEVEIGESIASIASNCNFKIKNYSKIEKLPLLNEGDILNISMLDNKEISNIILYKKNE